jgi:hypothetical protein
MASSVKVIVLEDVPTLILTGTGDKVLLQTGQMYIGGSDVSADNGIFLTGYYSDYFDLGVVAIGEEVYALSPYFDNEVRVMSISAT